MKSRINSFKQKMIILLVALLLFNFAVPTVSNADAVSLITRPVKGLLLVVFDAFNHIVEWSLMGSENVKWTWDDSPIQVQSGSNRKFDKGNSISVPSLRISPDEIFMGKIPLLNANFFSDNGMGQGTDSSYSSDKIDSQLSVLRTTIASWYKGLRYIAIVGLMCVLVYVAIRMVLSATAGDKAKYKKMLFDWIVALCLIFFMHYIMAFAMNLSEKMVSFFAGNGSTKVGLMGNSESHDTILNVPSYNSKDGLTGDYVRNFVEFVRVYSQLEDISHAFSYVILYIVLTCYTMYFAVIYLKRFLYLAFLTIIAPLVSLTYPLDKISDGKAQAFNMWLKEYMYNALLQPFHALIYRVFVLMSINMAGESLLYTCVAIGFMIPAEKFLKKMFGFDKASTPSPVGAMATGAAMSEALSNIKSRGDGSKKGGSSGGGDNAATADSQVKFKGVKNGYDAFGGTGNAGSLESNNRGLPAGANTQQSRGNNSNMMQNNMDSGIGNEQLGREETNPDVRDRLETDLSSEDRNNIDSRENMSSDNRMSDNIDTPQMSRKEALKEMGKNGLKDAVSTIKRKCHNIPSTLWNNKGKAGRFIAKKGLGALAAAGLGAVGLGVGIATGDPSKAFQMAGLGVAAGMNAGGRLGNKLSDAGSKISKPLGQRYRDARWGVKASNERAARNKFLNNQSSIKAYQDYYAQKGERLNISETQDRMKEAWNYKRFGLSDSDAIKAMKFKQEVLDDRYSNKTEADRISMAAKYSEMSSSISNDVLHDPKKLAVAKNNLMEYMDENTAERFLTDMSDYHNMGEGNYDLGSYNSGMILGEATNQEDSAEQEAERRRNYIEDQERQRKFKEHFEQKDGGRKMEQQELNTKMEEAYDYHEKNNNLSDETIMKAMDFEAALNTDKDTVNQVDANRDRARAMGSISQEQNPELKKKALRQYAKNNNLTAKQARDELNIFNNGL